MNMKYNPYTKVINLKDFYGVCAIYERNPFGDKDDLCWVYYDWCGNAVGLSMDMPEGEVVDMFTEENIGNQKLADYLNIEPVNFDHLKT
jgi:hypothetical protein